MKVYLSASGTTTAEVVEGTVNGQDIRLFNKETEEKISLSPSELKNLADWAVAEGLIAPTQQIVTGPGAVGIRL